MWRCLFSICFIFCMVHDSICGSFTSRRIIYRGTGDRNFGQPTFRSWRPTPRKTQTVTKLKRIKLSAEQKKAFVDAHNKARSDVNPPAADMVPVEWDPKIEKISKKFVQKCQFIHSQGSDRKIKAFEYPLGENLFVGMHTVSKHRDPEYITNKWVAEKDDYNIKDMSCKPNKMCGHYTQVVWSTTRKIGCAMAACPSMKGVSSNMLNLIVACHYGPTGNWVGQKPYKIGESCSECPKDSQNACRNDLCY